MKPRKIKSAALGLSLAIYGVITMFVLSILGLFDLFGSAVEMMEAFHIGYSLSFLGIFIGMIEAAVFCFVSGVIVAFFYNKMG